MSKIRGPRGQEITDEEEVLLIKFANSALQGLRSLKHDGRFTGPKEIAAIAWKQAWEMLALQRQIQSGYWPE
jgi:hypothetical protein